MRLYCKLCCKWSWTTSKTGIETLCMLVLFHNVLWNYRGSVLQKKESSQPAFCCLTKINLYNDWAGVSCFECCWEIMAECSQYPRCDSFWESTFLPHSRLRGRWNPLKNLRKEIFTGALVPNMTGALALLCGTTPHNMRRHGFISVYFQCDHRSRPENTLQCWTKLNKSTIS